MIRQLQSVNAAQQHEIEALRREIDRLNAAAAAAQQQARPPPDHPFAQQDQFGRPRPPELPPLRSLQPPAGPPGPPGAPESMTGVQYV